MSHFSLQLYLFGVFCRQEVTWVTWWAGLTSRQGTPTSPLAYLTLSIFHSAPLCGRLRLRCSVAVERVLTYTVAKEELRSHSALCVCVLCIAINCFFLLASVSLLQVGSHEHARVVETRGILCGMLHMFANIGKSSQCRAQRKYLWWIVTSLCYHTEICRHILTFDLSIKLRLPNDVHTCPQLCK